VTPEGDRFHAAEAGGIPYQRLIRDALEKAIARK
jgi:predicted DNA binding CopG/RHH family protein